MLKQQVKNNNTFYTRNPLSIDHFDFHDALSSFDPLLWNLVTLLTASALEISVYKKASPCVASERIVFHEGTLSSKMKEVR